jgi:hypothetical protein
MTSGRLVAGCILAAGLAVGGTVPSAAAPVTPSPSRSGSLANAFAFVRAINDPDVRAEMDRVGYVGGMVVIVGRYAPEDGEQPPAQFRAWRDDTVTGGWTGRTLP